MLLVAVVLALGDRVGQRISPSSRPGLDSPLTDWGRRGPDMMVERACDRTSVMDGRGWTVLVDEVVYELTMITWEH